MRISAAELTATIEVERELVFARLTELIAELLSPGAIGEPRRVGVNILALPIEPMLTLFVNDLFAMYENDGFLAERVSRVELDDAGLRAALEGSGGMPPGPPARLRELEAAERDGRLAVRLVVATAGEAPG